MTDIIVTPTGNVYGELNFEFIAPSKSILHRLIICAALAGDSMPYFSSDDICATYHCMQHILKDDRVCHVGESASTLRFLIPLSVVLGGRVFQTSGRLIKRSLAEYQCMRFAQIRVSDNIVTTSGQLICGDFYLRGDISSQFISGLMFALPLLDGDSCIHLTTQLESLAYAQMTRYVLAHHGIIIDETDYGYHIYGNQHYLPCDKQLNEGDWSYAAFFVVANALGSRISLTGLESQSLQADSAINSLLYTTEVDVSQCPDLFPALCVLACGRNSRTRIYNAGRLRYKESDRICAMTTELRKLGAVISETDDSVIIHGTGELTGGTVFSHNDHRVAMALAIAAACICTDAVTIHGAECVKKSAPDFFSHLESLHIAISEQ